MMKENYQINWTTNKDHDNPESIYLPSFATKSGDSKPSILYLYMDESGNFDFGEKGTKYFIMTCVVCRRPFTACHDLMNAKYDCFEQGIVIKKFHATDDNNETRKTVYGIIEKEKHKYSAYSIYIDKDNLRDDMKDAGKLYYQVFEWIINKVFESEIDSSVKKVIAVTDDLPKEAKKKQIAKPLKQFLKSKSKQFGIETWLEHYPSESDFNLQIADYACWAFMRLKSQGKDWPYRTIKSIFAQTGHLET